MAIGTHAATTSVGEPQSTRPHVVIDTAANARRVVLVVPVDSQRDPSVPDEGETYRPR